MSLTTQVSPAELSIHSESWGTDLTRGLVSVIMPAYNCAASIGRSIDSVLSQTYADWELLVVDDGSRDGTLRIVEEFANKDSRVRVLRKPRNEGVARARNTGLQAARGQYIAFLDSDDVWMAHKLSMQVDFLEEHGAAFCFSSYVRFSPDLGISEPVRVPEQIDYNGLLGGNVIACLTVLIDRSVVGSFRMPNIPHEDYATWLNILRAGHEAYGIQRDLGLYGVSATSLSSNKLRSARWTWNVLRDHEGLPFLRAMWCFVRYAVRAIGVHHVQNKPKSASICETEGI